MRVLRVVLIVLVVLAWVPLAAVTVSRLLGGDRFPTTQLASFAPVAAVGWVVALVLLLVLRSWKLALLPLVAVVLHVFWIGQPWVGALRKPTSDIGTAVSVLTINTQYGGADAGRVAALVADDDVDIVAVQEMTPDFASRFDPAVRTRLPYRVIHAEAGSPAGSGIWSKWPVKDLGSLPTYFHSAQGDVQVPNIGIVRVTSVHMASPVPSRQKAWGKDLATLRDQVGVDRPQIMLGDFNATPDHRPFRRLLGQLSDADSEAIPQPWRGLTWPMGLRFVPPSLRIDHVLMSKNAIVVKSARTANVPGTDHRALLARLVVRPNGSS